MSIPDIVKKRRLEAGWSQTELAQRTGGAVTQTMISRIEKGDDNMTLKTLRGLALAFGCRAVDLLPETDHQKAA